MRLKHSDENLSARGGYILSEPGRAPEAVILATGSEVALARAAQDMLAGKNVAARIVSLPCIEIFERQDQAWRDTVLPPYLPVVTLEAGVTRGWGFYAADRGAAIGLDRFGESAPASDLFAHFGFTAEHVAETVRRVISDSNAD